MFGTKPRFPEAAQRDDWIDEVTHAPVTIPKEEMSVADAVARGPIDVTQFDPSKAYVGRLQLGACRRWRQFGHGRWAIAAACLDSNGKPQCGQPTHYRHVPAVHRIGPFSGSTFGGLASAHNKYLQNVASEETMGHKPDDARTEVPAGVISRQLLVTSWEESDQPAKDSREPVQARQFEMLAQAIAKALATAMRGRTAAK